MPWMWLLGSVALAAQEVVVVDNDADGFEEGYDCDDSDPTLNPGADELCDGIDNDCDGYTDDADNDVVGGATWADLDGDGYGDPLNTRCDAATGLDNDLDCNDRFATVNPDGTEICDGLDNDCDGATSEDGTAAFDGQGFNSLAAAIEAAPSGATIVVCGDQSGSYAVDRPLTVVPAAASVSSPRLTPEGQDAIFRVSAGAVLTLNGLELTEGRGALVGDERLGGAVYVGAGAAVHVSYCSLSGNEATHGGAIAVDGGTLSIEASELSGNHATDLGGAVYARNGTLVLEGVAVRENGARYGGAYAIRDGSVSLGLSYALVEFNEATVAGGGLALFGDVAMIVSGVIVSQNRAPLGGGFYLEGGTFDLPPIIINNNVADDGGNAAIVSATASFRQPEIAGGIASRGGGLYIEDSSVEIIGLNGFARVLHNQADLGGGAYLAGPGARLVSTHADWGMRSWDNGKADVYLAHDDGAKSYSYKGDQTFECDASIPLCDPAGQTCGCASSGASSGWLVLGGLAAATLRRRSLCQPGQVAPATLGRTCSA